MLPEFRAALHAGPVVTGEMGDTKLEIVLLGDTVNTTARIEQACRELDRAILVSAEALALINLPNGTESERMPPAALKGKSRQARLYAINRTGPTERDEWPRLPPWAYGLQGQPAAEPLARTLSGRQRAPCDGRRHRASMRPRHKAAENGLTQPLSSRHPQASMRPRHKAAENVVGRIGHVRLYAVLQ